MSMEEFETLEGALELLRGDIKAIKIMRDGKYLTTVYPEELQGWDIQEWLKERYGGGKYTLQLIKKDGKFGKSFTFIIEGRPKEISEEKPVDPTVYVLLEQIKELKEELRKKGTENSGDVFKYLLEIEKENRKEMFQLFLELMKKEEKKSGLLESFLKEAIRNPQVLITIGGGLWKVLEKGLIKRDELIDLIKIAKDDPELKSVISEAVSAKYGGNKSLLEAIFENPEIINKFLDTLNRLLIAKKQGKPLPPKEVKEDPQMNPLQVYSKLLSLLAKGKETREIYNALTEHERAYLRGYLTSTGIETAEELIGVLKASEVPQEYIAILKENKEKVNEFIGLILAEKRLQKHG